MRKIRPAVVVSRDKHNLSMATVTVAPLSSGEAKSWIDEVPIPEGAVGDGRPSRVKAHQLRAVDKSRFGRRIGRMPDEAMATLDGALRVHLGLI